MAGFPMAKAREFVKRHRQLAKLKATLEALKVRQTKAEAELLEAFSNSGMQNVTLDGAIVFIHRQLWASPAAGQREALNEALKGMGMADIVKESVNAQTLSAYVRELPRNADDAPVLPPQLTGLVSVADTISVRVNEK